MSKANCVSLLLLFIVSVTVGQVADLKMGVYRKAAVGGRDQTCANVAKDTLAAGGHAVDAAISQGFCLGIPMPQAAGIGGGNFMVIYDKKTGEITTIDARETAPLKATANMFTHNPKLSLNGALAIGVPGEVAGYWAAHQKYGKLPWKQLLQPAIKQCREGTKADRWLAKTFKKFKNYLMTIPASRGIYFKPNSNETVEEGETYYVGEALCKTLEKIAEEGRDGFYKGSVAEKMAEDIQKEGGIITVEDLKAYKVVWRTPIQFDLNDGLKYVTLPPPSGGVLVGFILKVLQNYNFTAKDLEDNEALTYHRITEALKYGYAQRTKLGDESFYNITNLVNAMMCDACAKAIWRSIDDTKTFSEPQHYGAYTRQHKNTGTLHSSILADDGSAVAVTASINSVLGSGIQSAQTGVIFNNHMNDFSIPGAVNTYGLPPSPSNFIVPGKRPMSSMSPSLIFDKKKDVVLVTGGAGGSKIISVLATFIAKLIWFGQDLKTATSAPRLHHQLIPMRIEVERDMDRNLLKELKNKGHQVKLKGGMGGIFSVYKQNGYLYAFGEPRRQSGTAGF